jgi:hypothetical protein
VSHADPIHAEQVLLSLKDRFPWALDLWEQLRDYPAASEAFEQLIEKGCNPEDLLYWLDFACRGHLTTHARDRRELGQAVAELAKQLLNGAKRLQRFEASAKTRLILKTLQLPEFQKISESLYSYAECLMNEGEGLNQSLSAKEAPGLATGWLASRVEGSTDRTYYLQIARLMEAHYLMRGIHKDISSRAVEKQAKRFRQKHAMAYSHMKNMASRQFGKRTEEYISGPGTPPSTTKNA